MQTPELAAGQLIAGRYRLERLIGRGGMGVVWAATRLEDGQPVALKMLRGHSSARADLRRRLLREARTAASIRHPNVVYVHDVFDDDDQPVIVMDLLDGETLRAKLSREERLPLGEVASILLPVVSAIAAAQAQRIVHRDLKPDNIFLSRGPDGTLRIKVLDFGIAKLVSAENEPGDSASLTSTGTMLGTPCYMAPEQGFGEPLIDGRADVWALGVILYESLSGGRPIEGDNLGQVLKRLMGDGITPLDRVLPDAPADVVELVSRMLAREREERLSDLDEVQKVLEAHATGERDNAQQAWSARAKGTRTTGRWVGVAALVAALAVTAVVGWWASNTARPEDRSDIAKLDRAPAARSLDVPQPTPGAQLVLSSDDEATSPREGVTGLAASAKERTESGERHRTFATPHLAKQQVQPVTPTRPHPSNTILGGLAEEPPF